MNSPQFQRFAVILVFLFAGCDSQDPPGTPQFVDRTAAAGISFHHVCGGAEKDYILEVNGGGVALFDYDGDSDLDIFLVNGNRFDAPENGRPPPTDRLYRNNGDWRFTDVTAPAGLTEDGWGCGVAVADVDNDGDLDLYVTNYGPDQLWINNGDGTFRAADDSGAADPGWGASCVFFDYDRDGWVDLFVVNYLVFSRETVAPRGENSCEYKGQRILCGPVGFPGAHCTLYRNVGGGKFQDVSEATGIHAVRPGYGLGVVTGDYDGDGFPDIYVAADSTENLLFRNLNGERFEELGQIAGVACNDKGVRQAGMGVDFGFVQSAMREDLFVVNYEDDTNTYYRNDGGGFFLEVTSVVGLGCFKALGWGTFFVDVDLDGDLDNFIANGHVVPQADQIDTSPGYRQRNRLFLNDGTGKFVDISEDAGPGLAVKKSSRGAAYGDLDGDGDPDIVVNDIDDQATVLENVGPPRGHWLAVRLIGTKSNRAAIGAVVQLQTAPLAAAGGATEQARRIRSASSYASHSEIYARFGLGAARKVDRLRVTWPTGEIEEFAVEGVDRRVTLTEGQGRIR